jgi:hypothetical protein
VYAIGGACGLLGAVVLVPVLWASRRVSPVAAATDPETEDEDVQEHAEADERVVARVAS